MKKCEQCGQMYEEVLALCPSCGAAPQEHTDAAGTDPIETQAADLPETQAVARPQEIPATQAVARPQEIPETQAVARPEEIPETQAAAEPREVPAPADNVPRPPVHKGKNAWVAPVAAVVVAAGVTAAVGANYYFGSPAKEVQQLIRNKNYDEALKTYREQLAGDKTQEKMLVRMLKSTIRDSADRYWAGSMKYEDFAAQSKLILSFELPALTSEIHAQFGREAAAVQRRFVDKKLKLADARRKIQQMLDDGLLDDSAGTYTAMLDEMTQLQSSREAYTAGCIYLDHKNYGEALKNFRLVIESDENYSDAQQKLTQCTDAYRSEILMSVMLPTTRAEYDQAVAALQKALELLPGDEALLQRLQSVEDTYDEIEKQEALRTARMYADSLNFRAALDVLNRAREGREDDLELQAAVNSVKSAYSAYAKKLVANCLASRDYNTAYTYLVEACALMPEDAALQALLADIEVSAPTGLHKLAPGASNRFQPVSTGHASDAFGNSYNGPNLFRLTAKSGDWDDADLGYVKYDLTQSGSFSRLFGTVVMASDSSAGNCAIRVYGDGRLLYTTPMLTRDSAPVRLDVDLTGVKELEFRMDVGEDTREAMMVVLLSGVQLYP